MFRIRFIKSSRTPLIQVTTRLSLMRHLNPYAQCSTGYESKSAPNVVLRTDTAATAPEPQRQSSVTAVQAKRMDLLAIHHIAITRPLDQIRDLQATITLEQGVLEDAQTALVRLSAHIQHHTNLLGDELHIAAYCVAFRNQMNEVLMEQRDALEAAHQHHLHEMEEMRQCNQKHAGNIRSLHCRQKYF